MKKCIACGMPMESPRDYPEEDTTKPYCRHCARPDGRMQSYEEKRENLTRFVVNTQGLEQTAARRVAETMMRDLPAWREGNEPIV